MKYTKASNNRSFLFPMAFLLLAMTLIISHHFDYCLGHKYGNKNNSSFDGDSGGDFWRRIGKTAVAATAKVARRTLTGIAEGCKECHANPQALHHKVGRIVTQKKRREIKDSKAEVLRKAVINNVPINEQTEKWATAIGEQVYRETYHPKKKEKDAKLQGLMNLPSPQMQQMQAQMMQMQAQMMQQQQQQQQQGGGGGMGQAMGGQQGQQMPRENQQEEEE